MRPISKIRKARELKRSLFNFTDRPGKKISAIFINILSKILKLLSEITFLSRILSKNAYDLILAEHEFYFENLPEEFEGYSILFMSDFHIDLVEKVEPLILETIGRTKFDLCVLGGDYAYKYKEENIKLTKDFSIRLIQKIKSKDKKICGILGNHDIYEFGNFLEENGVIMLVNESIKINRKNSHIFISAIDDAYFYKSHDFSLCEESIDCKNSFKILISHTPDVYKETESRSYNLVLCGHTHGGQICLPGGFPPYTSCKAPRKISKGKWKYGNLQGFTTRGVGCSGFAGRLFCPPEIGLIRLRKTKI